MENSNKNIDTRKLSLEQHHILEQHKAAKRQLQVLEDIADITQELVNVFDNGNKGTQDMGVLLTDMREALNALKDKEAPSIPDYAKPVVSAVEKLEKAVRAIDVKPEFKPAIKVNAPEVKVNTPDLNLKGVEKVLKTDMPKAFEKAMKLIPAVPAVNLTPLEQQIREMTETLSKQLADIDTGVRLKPLPGSMKVTNADGTPVFTGETIVTNVLVPEDFDYIAATYPDADTEVYTYRTGGVGGTVVAVITVNYTDSTKESVLNVART